MLEKENDRREKGWNPEVQSGEQALTTGERSFDIGESAQFASDRYDNQRTKNEPKHTLDDIVPPGRC